ncbi:MAG: tRNA (5-methylaminomethyl-2-thiouridine)(34)-methyltransferase MnmD [Saprospiraceae bacterium]
MEGHRIFETQDGSRSLFSERFGVSYHSRYGAWQETQHVFIEAGLRYQAIDQTEMSVLDIGFGTGLNCIASLLFAFQQNIKLQYVGLEAYPVPTETLKALDYPSLLEWDSGQVDLYDRMHAIEWNGETQAIQTSKEAVSLEVTKRKEKFEQLTDTDQFDVIYYDAFAPEAQPELWTIEMFERMHKALKPGGVLVTYCAKGQVKRDMKAAGFTIERLKGPPGKREMTRASKA